MQSFLFSKKNKRILDGILSQNKIANAYLFHGQIGSFLSQAALYFATASICTNDQNKPCMACENCISIIENRCPDFLQLSDLDKITVDTIRNIQETVKYGPTHHRRFFVIINNIHNITIQAANAFLKTLEEPEPGVTFILLTHNILDVLPTIQSRCQQLYFPLCDPEDLFQHVKNTPIENENISSQEIASNPMLAATLLENNNALSIPYISYIALTNKPIQERLSYAYDLSKTKQSAVLVLLLWIGEIWHQEHPIKEKDLKNIELLVDKLSKMKYNLNLRLHLEELIINL